jgi:hypothetical protein
MACRSVSSFVSRDLAYGRAMPPPSTQLQISIRGRVPPSAVNSTKLSSSHIDVIAFN